jgi:hypothetical protein
MSVTTFAEDIEEAVGGDACNILACVIGTVGFSYYDDDPEKGAPVRRGVLLSWDEARPMLDYKFDAGFGGQDCHNVWVWTPDRVLFVAEYDGATSVEGVPRNPTAGDPQAI